MPDGKTAERPKNRETENEMVKGGKPPRPATEPAGAKGSSRNGKTMTDPSTGEPQQGR
jgi:hypothetical protein